MMIMMVCFEMVFSEFSGFKDHDDILHIYTHVYPKIGEHKCVKPLKKSTTDLSGMDWSRMQWTLWSQNLEILLPLENGPESLP